MAVAGKLVGTAFRFPVCTLFAYCGRHTIDSSVTSIKLLLIYTDFINVGFLTGSQRYQRFGSFSDVKPSLRTHRILILLRILSSEQMRSNFLYQNETRKYSGFEVDLFQLFNEIRNCRLVLRDISFQSIAILIMVL